MADPVATMRNMHLPLVGRETQFDTLLSAVIEPPAVVLVEGEAGIGKTRLVTELAKDASLRSRWVVTGNCLPLREPFPLGAILDCLRRAAGRLPDVTSLNPVIGVLRPYLPEIAERLPPPPGLPPEPATRRHLVFRAIRYLLDALGPTVLVLEDLQWADDETRAALWFLLSDPPDGLSLVLTCRPEEVGEGGPLGTMCRSAVRARTARIRLDPLDLPQVQHLAAEFLGAHTVSGEFAAALHDYTAGIPFLIKELLGTVNGNGPRARLLEDPALPVALREALTDRLDRLSADARLIAQAAAVLAEPADLELLGCVAAVDADRGLAGIVEALTGNVLVEREDNRFGFRHALGARAVYETLPGPRRQQLHARAADALRERNPLRLRELAEHSRRAGRADDWLAFGEAAADQAMVSSDVSTATRLLRRLLADPALRTSDLDRLAAKFGRACSNGVEVLADLAALEGLMADGRMSQAIRSEIRLSLGLLLVRHFNGLAASRVELELAAGELKQRPALAARCMAVLAQPFVGTAPLSDSLRWMHRVEAVIEDCSEKPWRTSLLANVLGSRTLIGDPTVWDLVGRLPDAVDDPAEQRELARAHCNLADGCAWTGHYEKARSFLHTGLRLAADCGARYEASVGRSTELHLDWLTGNWCGLAERAIALRDSCHDLLPVSTEASLVLGALAAAHGEWEEAEQQLARTGMSTPDNAITPVVIAAHAIMIQIRLSTNDIAAAADEADRGLSLLRRKGVWAWAGELAPAAATAYCLAARLDDAATLIAELESATAGLDAPLPSAAIPACRAELANASGDVGAAGVEFEQAKLRYEALPRPYEAIRSAERLLLASPECADELVDLADAFDALGAVHDAARCRHLSRTRGATRHSRRGRRGYGNQLSPRERNVAQLMARGLTNREIADAMFLSQRTIEQHVSSILRKTGAPSRHALTNPIE